MKRWLLATVVGVTVGCASGGGAPVHGARDATDLVVEIENDHWQPMKVWAVWPGAREFLGEVSPSGHYVYRVSGSVLTYRGDVRLLAESVGTSEEVTTRPIEFTAHRVRWRLGKHLLTSRPFVF